MEVLTNVVNKAIATLDHIKSAIIRNGVEVPEGSSTATYGEKIDEVFDAGVDSVAPDIDEQIQRLNEEIEGAEEGQTLKEEIFEAGKKAEYDAFWDAYQNYGNRRNYAFAFSRGDASGASGSGWPDSIFKPKYDIICIGYTSAVFQYNDASNIKQTLESAGLVLDTSEGITFTQFAQGCQSIELPFIDISKSTNTSYAFSACVNLKSLHLKSSETTPYSNTFSSSSKIENLIIEGTIGQNGFNVKWSPLNKTSLTSVINALSTTTSGLTVTLRLSAVNTAFETTSGANDGSTSEEWQTLIATKPNWTISLIDS